MEDSRARSTNNRSSTSSSASKSASSKKNITAPSTSSSSSTTSNLDAAPAAASSTSNKRKSAKSSSNEQPAAAPAATTGRGRVTRASAAAASSSTPASSLSLSTQQQPQQKKSRRNTASTSDASSQRGLSPFSAPATPATAFSTATTVSSSVRTDKRAAGEAQATPSSLPRNAKSTRATSTRRASASTLPASAPVSTDAKGKKRQISPDSDAAESSNAASAAATSSSRAVKKQRKSQPAATTAAPSYNLRSRNSGSTANTTTPATPPAAQAKGKAKMAPKKSIASSSAPTAAAGAAASSSSVPTAAAKGKAKARAARAARTSARTANSASAAPEAPPLECDEMDVDAKEAAANNAGSDAEMKDAHSQHSGSVGGAAGEDDEDENDYEDEDDDEEEEAPGSAVGGGMHMMDEEDDDDDGEGPYDDEMDDPYGDGGGMGAGGAYGQLRAMAGYMSGLSGRFRTLLASLRNRSDPTTQLVALQELSEVLSISNEDTLAGYFPTESFVRELIFLMGGPKPPDAQDPTGAGSAETEEDRLNAAAIAAAAGEDNGEAMLLACRCLANLIEAMPYAAHSVVSLGVLPVLHAKLKEIQFIDLAEQVLQTLEKISAEYPSAIVREGGLLAMLQFIDFFGIHVQRTAMQAAANCCRKLSAESFAMVREVMPIVQNVLTYADQRLVESACKCVVRTVESYRHNADLLEQLLNPELIAAVNAILLPGSGSSSSTATIGTQTYTDLLKALSTAAHASPKVAVILLENNIVETLYLLLTGSAAPAEDGTGGRGPASTEGAGALNLEGSGAASGSAEQAPVAVVGASAASSAEAGGVDVAVADVAVLQNLAHRPKEQVQEALSLVGELLPPLPRDGVFDARAYSEKTYVKKQLRAAREAHKAAKAAKNAAASVKVEPSEADAAAGATAAEPAAASGSNGAAPASADAAAAASASGVKAERVKTERDLAKEAAQAKRIVMLENKPALVKRFTQLVLPTLVEVYAASVALHVRQKALLGILKIVSFVEPEPLNGVLDNVPLASFTAAILSSREHPTLVLAALQMVDLLNVKLPHVYSAVLRREGVVWEIEDLASKQPAKSLQTSKSGTKEKSGEAGAASSNATTAGAVAAASANAGLPGVSDMLGGPPAGSAAAAALASSQAAAGKAPAAPPTLADLEDANIWRARTLRDRFQESVSAAADSAADGSEAVRALDHIKDLVVILGDAATQDADVAKHTLETFAPLFLSSESPISSFELLRSGLVDGLYAFAVGTSEAVPIETRRQLLLEAFMARDEVSGTTAAAVLVRRLQETLSRLEKFDITTAISSGGEDARRGPTANVARLVRLKLVAEGNTADIPRTCNNVVVSIHAIAAFQTLNDYLRPKIALSAATGAAGAAGGSSASRLSGVLAAMAGSGLELPPGLAAAAAQATAAHAAATGTAGASSTGVGGSAPAAGSSTGAASGSKERPRRSSRLSGKSPEAEAEEEEAKPAAAGEEAAPAAPAPALDEDDEEQRELARRIVEGLIAGEMDEGPYSDEEDYEEEITEDGAMPGLDSLPGTGSAEEKTVNLKVASESNSPGPSRSGSGSTPAAAGSSAAAASSSSAPGASSSAASSSKPSYSSALQKKPTDWHLQFEMNGERVALDSTIYRAVHNYEMSAARQATGMQRYIWSNVYTIKYKKVDGPAPAANAGHQATPEPQESLSPEVELPSSVPEDAQFAKILQLLSVLHDLNSEWRETQAASSAASGNAGAQGTALSEAAFVNNKLTAKLNRQLEEPMIVASSCLPAWSLELPKAFPFLFPFEARYSFLQNTAFGYHRLIARWQTQQARNQDASSAASRNDDSLALLGRLSRQKVRIQRSNILASAFKVFELYGTSSALLEVEYFEEVGTGLGPTLEFYALVSKEFARKDLGLWRDDGAGAASSEYVSARQGLFPAPIEPKAAAAAMQAGVKGTSRITAFQILGQFVAKALLDSRIIDVNFSPVFMKAVLNQRIPETLASLEAVDAALARSMAQIQAMSAEDIEALSLDFTLPGNAEYELHEGGKAESVTVDNVERYVQEVASHTLNIGIRPLVRAFRRGFNLIFPIASMSSFTADELVLLFGDTDEDWSEATLLGAIKPDHGFNGESPAFRDIVSIMSTFDVEDRRRFLQWLTGSPKLPIGGLAGLHPQLTIVKRPHEAPLTPDDYLPSVMTCVNYLKLPSYSTRETMRRRLDTAMREGGTSFHLS